MAFHKILGITDEVNSCDCCGRENLKRTVILGRLDSDGNVEAVTYYGTICAAKVLPNPHLSRSRVESIAEQAQRDAKRALLLA